MSDNIASMCEGYRRLGILDINAGKSAGGFVRMDKKYHCEKVPPGALFIDNLLVFNVLKFETDLFIGGLTIYLLSKTAIDNKYVVQVAPQGAILAVIFFLHARRNLLAAYLGRTHPIKPDAISEAQPDPSRLLKNSSRRHARLAKPSSALRFLAVAMATAAKPCLDLGSARRTCHQNEFFNSLLAANRHKFAKSPS